MTNDDSRAQFPSWKVELVTKAFSANEESAIEDLLKNAREPKFEMNEHEDNINCCYKDIDINDNPVNSEDKASSNSFSDTVIQSSRTEIPVTSDIAKARTKIVDYDITKDSDSDMSSSGASTPEKRDSLHESQGKTVNVVTNQAGQIQTPIVDIEDSDSSDDADLLTLTFVRKVEDKSNHGHGVLMDGPRIVEEILKELATDAVENSSMYVVQEILETCIERIDYSKAIVEEKIDLPSLFGATDIRYRKDAKQVVKDNALSVVIISVHTKSLSSFYDSIKNIKSRARYENEASSSDVIRMDFVFTLEKDRIAFHERIESLLKPQEVYMVTKAIPEKDLSYKDPPTLTEEQLLHVWHDNRSLNMFSGFDIELLVEDEKISFKFESMSALSLFLYCTLGIEKAHLGKVKQAAKVYETLKLKSRFRKKEKVEFFPLHVKYTSRSVDLASLSQKFKCKAFGYKNVRGKPISVTFDFKTKKDLYMFLTSPEARAFKEILYS